MLLKETDFGDYGRLIELDSVNASDESSEVTGSAYIFPGSTLGESSWTMIEVTTGDYVAEFIVQNGMINMEDYAKDVFWFAHRDVETCETVNGPPYEGPTRVVSKTIDGVMAYKAYAARSSENGPCGLGMFVKYGDYGNLDFSVRKITFDTKLETAAIVDPLSGEGESFKTLSTWIESNIYKETCFNLILDSFNSSSSVDRLTLLSILQEGARIVVAMTCQNPYSVGRPVTYMSEAERIVVRDALYESAIVTSYLRGGVAYTYTSMSWFELTVNSLGTVQANGQTWSCNIVKFYAEENRKMYRFTIDRAGLVLNGSE